MTPRDREGQEQFPFQFFFPLSSDVSKHKRRKNVGFSLLWRCVEEKQAGLRKGSKVRS